MCIPLYGCSILESLLAELQARAADSTLTHEQQTCTLEMPSQSAVHGIGRNCTGVMLVQGEALRTQQQVHQQFTGGLQGGQDLGVTQQPTQHHLTRPSPDTVLGHTHAHLHNSTMYSTSSRSSNNSMQHELSMPFSHGAKSTMSMGSSDEDITVNCKKGSVCHVLCIVVLVHDTHVLDKFLVLANPFYHLNERVQ